jgi:TonB family protein
MLPAARTLPRFLATTLLVMASAVVAQAQPEAPPVPLTAPRVLKFVDAPRPEGVGADGAVVELDLSIAADGKLTDAQVAGSAGPAWDQAALEAVRAFAFEPAHRGDRAVPARIRYRYTFAPLAPSPTVPDAPADETPEAPPADRACTVTATARD